MNSIVNSEFHFWLQSFSKRGLPKVSFGKHGESSFQSVIISNRIVEFHPWVNIVAFLAIVQAKQIGESSIIQTIPDCRGSKDFW